MATRSTIALEFADGTVQQVYCHWDGYLDGVGAELTRSFTDPFKLRDLIDGGDMSSIGEPYTQRGESIEDTKAECFQNFDDYVRNAWQEEYDYILRQVNGKPVWFVRCWATADNWVTIDNARQIETERLSATEYGD